jgi:DNA polymerase/3'-5' exonuclease PolX
MPFLTAYRAALVAGDLLNAACERLKIAGSLRRLDDQVGDIEFVAIPKMGKETADLLGGTRPVNLIEKRVEELLAGDQLVAHPEKPKNGPRYKKLWLRDPGIQVDLFIVLPPAQWGPAMVIRTGPAEFSRAMVTRLRARGLHSEDLVVKKLDGGAPVDCPDEATFFKLVGLPMQEPELRRG